MNVKDIYWAAGILEGEGTFVLSGNSPSIKLKMTDPDVVERVYAVFNNLGSLYMHKKDREYYKQAYTWKVNGKDAIAIMMTIYTLMGERRKEKITSIIQHWKTVLNPRNRKQNTILKKNLGTFSGAL